MHSTKYALKRLITNVFSKQQSVLYIKIVLTCF
ncbi:unknown [Prevotella sp. CAG:1320]|nr:unknown [Prevotella sp. CAG:1320]